MKLNSKISESVPPHQQQTKDLVQQAVKWTEVFIH